MGIFERVSDTLRGRFTPAADLKEAGEELGNPTTLYGAICETVGLRPTDSAMSASNHQAIRGAIRAIYEALDEVIGERSQPWAMRPERTEQEVLDALSRAASRNPNTDYDDVQAQIRVGVSKVGGRGKLRGALASEVARVAHVQQRPFAQVLADHLIDGRSEIDALVALEAVGGLAEQRDINWTTAQAWSRGYGRYTSESSDLSLLGYCRWLSTDWGDLGDEALIEAVVRVEGPAR